MAKDDGGPAFPRVGEGFGNSLYDAPGMSLRDWFAGQALVGLVVNDETTSVHCPLSARAYEIADAMLAAREGR
jgi:hypothetical protein